MKSHSLLLLSQKDVVEAGVLDMSLAVPLMEKVYTLHWKGDDVIPQKGVIRWGGTESEWVKGRINALPAWIGGDIRTGGIKWIAVCPEAAMTPENYKVGAIVVINDPDTLYPAAVMEGSVMSAVRTGANMGAAARHLAKKDSHVLAIFGAGFQGRTQLMALHEALPSIDDVRIFDPNPVQVASYVESMKRRTGITVRPCSSIEETTADADIVVTATGAAKPFLMPGHLAPGALYLHMGSNECAYDVIKKADKRFVDDWDQIKHRGCSSIARMHADGLLMDSEITGMLGAVMAGDLPGRESDKEIIYVNTVGLGIQDVALGSLILANARARGIGTPFELWDGTFVL